MARNKREDEAGDYGIYLRVMAERMGSRRNDGRGGVARKVMMAFLEWRVSGGFQGRRCRLQRDVGGTVGFGGAGAVGSRCGRR